MNYEKDLFKKLEDAGYSAICYKGDGWDEVDPKECTEINISNWNEGVVAKVIRVPKKKEVTFEWIMNKLNSEAIYENFSHKFKKLLEEKGYRNSINVYPTSYGIGFFVMFNFRNENSKIKNDIDSILNKYDIEYTNERSDAGWVFRYKISKKKENIEKLDKI